MERNIPLAFKKDAAITVWLEKDVLYPEAQFRADVRVNEGGPKRDRNHVRKRANTNNVCGRFEVTSLRDLLFRLFNQSLFIVNTGSIGSLSLRLIYRWLS